MHLHHDPAPRGERHSRARAEAVGAGAGCPRCDPPGVVQEAPRIGPRPRADARAAEARPAGPGALAVERRRLRRDGGRDAVQDHVVDE